MAIKGKIYLFYRRIKYRLVYLPKKMRNLPNRVKSLSMNIRLVISGLIKLSNIVSEINKKVAHEKKLRMDQSHRLKTTLREEIQDVSNHIDHIECNFNDLSERLSKLSDGIIDPDAFCEAIAKLNNKIDGFKKSLSVIDKAKSQIQSINDVYQSSVDLSDKAYSQYNNYLNDLKKSVSEFKESDGAVFRLSSLETRITMLELNAKSEIKENSERITMIK